MKLKISLLFLIFIANINTSHSQDQKKYASRITAEKLKEKLYIYASDEFEGRETGAVGQKIAVEYLKEVYKKLGIKAAKLDGDYFQNVPLVVVKPPKVTIKSDNNSFEYYQDFVSVTDAKTAVINSQDIILVGHGIKHENYNDYKDLDVTDKVVIAIAGEPKNEDGTYSVSGTKKISKWSNGRQELSSKRDAAKEQGAKAFFLINDYLFKRYAPYYKARDERGGESDLALDVNKTSMYGFLVSEAMGTDLLKTRALEINFNQVSEPIISENVAAIIEGKA